jgi:predicted nucleic acid-binding protein
VVLVDTSVWIRALANREPYSSDLATLLSRDEVAGHELVCGELSVGDKGGRKLLLAAIEQFHQASTVSHRDALALLNARRLHGRSVGWIDIHLLASALVNRLPLWTADGSLAEIAEELGVAYRPRLG